MMVRTGLVFELEFAGVPLQSDAIIDEALRSASPVSGHAGHPPGLTTSFHPDACGA